MAAADRHSTLQKVEDRPLDLADLFADTKAITVRHKGFAVAVEYSPGKYTARIHNLIVATRNDPSFDGLVDALTSVVTGWDITQGGEAVPVTRETMENLPIGFLMAATNAIMESVNSPK